MNVEQPPRPVTCLQIVELVQAEAPSLQPPFQFLELLRRAAEMHYQVDVACQPRGSILRASEYVESRDSESFRVEL